jgi:hypothetical protein
VKGGAGGGSFAVGDFVNPLEISLGCWTWRQILILLLDEFEMFTQTIRKFLALGLGTILSATNVAAYYGYDDSVCHPCMVVRCALPDWIPDDQSST